LSTHGGATAPEWIGPHFCFAPFTVPAKPIQMSLRRKRAKHPCSRTPNSWTTSTYAQRPE
jgi:hypothetical protein